MPTGTLEGVSGSRGLRNRHPFLQLFKPVQDDVEFGRGRSAIFVSSEWLDYEESLAIRADIPHATDLFKILPAKQLSRCSRTEGRFGFHFNL